MSFAIASSPLSSLFSIQDNAPTAPAVDPSELAKELAGLISDQPEAAAGLLRELAHCSPQSLLADLAAKLLPVLQEGGRALLEQTPAGREIIDFIDRTRMMYSTAGSGESLIRELAGRRAEVDRAVIRSASPSGASSTEALKNDFKAEFGALAHDKGKFDATMQKVFGDRYDRGLAEQYRQRALAGDYSWLPEVKLVDAPTLGAGNGAYNAADGVIYINKDLAAADPAKAAQTFVEEAGHHLDAKLNRSDSAGDEGELFRRTLSGESLSASEIAAIRSEDDKGTITVDGKEVEVEFWFGEDLVDGIGKAASDVADGAKSVVSDVGGAIADGAKWVGGAVSDGAAWVGSTAENIGNGIVNGASAVGEGIWGGVKNFGRGLYEMTGGALYNLVTGNIGEAFDSFVRGFDRAVFQSTQRFFAGAWDGVKSVADGVTDSLGPIGEPLRWVTDRLHDVGHTVIDTGFGIARDAMRLIPDTIGGFIGDMERAVKLAADGRWSDAAEQFGMGFVNVPKRLIGGPVDMALRFGQGVASAGQTMVGAEPPARGLKPDERAYLEGIYGDSIDYDSIRIKQGGPLNDAMNPHTVGNTVYLPEDGNFNPDGSLTRAGLETLGHEVGHVWQNQNGGGDYIHGALSAQAWAGITEDSWEDAYSWRDAFKDGASFESMNEEQRARVMEDIGKALGDGQRGSKSKVPGDGLITESDGMTATDDPRNYSPEEVAFLREVAEKLKAGEGAG